MSVVATLSALAVLVLGIIAANLVPYDVTPTMPVLPPGEIPANYYNMPIAGGEIAASTLVVPSVLLEHKWREMYQSGSFDCSQMSTFLEWVFENTGTEAQVCVSGEWVTEDGYVICHAWVRIKEGNSWEAIETTTLRHMPRGPDNRQYYDYSKMVCYDNIYSIANAYGDQRATFDSEWAWWLEEVD